MVAPLVDVLIPLPHYLGRLRVGGEFPQPPHLALALLLQGLCLRLVGPVLVFLLIALRNRRLGRQTKPRDNTSPTAVDTGVLLLADPPGALAQFLRVGQALSVPLVP